MSPDGRWLLYRRLRRELVRRCGRTARRGRGSGLLLAVDVRRGVRRGLQLAAHLPVAPGGRRPYARSDADLLELWTREPGGLRVLSGVLDAALPRRPRSRGPQDRLHRVLRRDRLDRAGRAARSRVDAGRAIAVLRRDARGDRAARRDGREVHRRRRHGGVRHPGAARGRRPPGGARRGGHARRARGAEQGARARPGRHDPDAHRRQHGRGRRGRSRRRERVRDGRCRERRRPPGAARRAGPGAPG